MSGAFCSTISPRITPFVLINYTGESRDLFTLAHELGHAVHSMAAGSKSILVQHAPLPLAETASTFSEMLLYDVISGEMGQGEETTVLAGKIDDLYATIPRQAFFTMFEAKAHQKLVDGATAGQGLRHLRRYAQRAVRRLGRGIRGLCLRGGWPYRTFTIRRSTATRTRSGTCWQRRCSSGTRRRGPTLSSHTREYWPREARRSQNPCWAGTAWTSDPPTSGAKGFDYVESLVDRFYEIG